MSGLVGRRLSAVVLALLCVAGVCPGSRADSTEIKLSDVPEVVRRAADQGAPNVIWVSATKHEEGKDVSFELGGKNGKQRDVSVTVTANGKVEQIQTEMAFDDLPAAVSRAALAAVPKFGATDVYEVREGKDLYYSLEGQDALRRPVSLYVSTDGKVDEVSTEVTDRDVPKAVLKGLTATFPRFTATAYYEVRKDGKVDRYDIEGHGPKGADERTESFRPDGKHIKE